MSASKEVRCITISDGKLRIENWVTDDPDIVGFFQDFDESDNLEERLTSLVKTGISVAKSAKTQDNIDYVEAAFENLNSRFDKRMKDIFGDDGDFASLIKDHFGQDGRIIKEVFSPSREESPLYVLKQELGASLSEIMNQLAANKGAAIEREKGTQKGFDFEDRCSRQLELIARTHSDKLEKTGTLSGKLGNSKKGDFVITLGDTGQVIVFEAKDNRSVSQNDIQKEMSEAMKNRNADYGIFIMRKRSMLPDAVGWFNEYDGNHLICAVEDDDGVILDHEIIEIAYKWARARLRLTDMDGTKSDISFMLEKSNEIKLKIAEMKQIRRQCTIIENASGEIRHTATSAENGIKSDLEEIIQSLSKPRSC